MKKILSIFTSTIIVLISITSNAEAVNTKDAIFKEIALTTTQVEKDYSKKYNDVLDLYFNKIRYYKNKSQLDVLEKKLEPLLEKYNKRTYLNLKQKKELNLIKNIYYRSKVLSLYYVK
ncbi:MAG: hypothetical protein PHV23_05650 [Candidatus Gracilibacteria bacterium]|nr:hypothetical protein [Candidatus Gracilibacteria bacterium]